MNPIPGDREAAERDRLQQITTIVANLVATLRSALMYSPGHSRFFQALEKVQTELGAFLTGAPEFTLVNIENEILFQGQPLNKLGAHFQKLADIMRGVGINRLRFLPGLTAQELRRFILNLAGLNEMGMELPVWIITASPHIRIGRLMRGQKGAAPMLTHDALVSLLAAGVIDETGGEAQEKQKERLASSGGESQGRELQQVDVDLLTRAQTLLKGYGARGGGRALSLKDSIAAFVHQFLRYSEPLMALSPLREHDELSFDHSVNVCLLTAAQAEALRFPPEAVRDIALAGLLHDVGKVKVPPEVLNKEEPLAREEKVALTRHPLEGARILAPLSDIPRVAVIAAYEHHLRYHGEGGYPRSRRIQDPHPVSQMVALADFFDSLLTQKPYRDAQPLEKVLTMMKERTGTHFNPALMRNFLTALEILF